MGFRAVNLFAAFVLAACVAAAQRAPLKDLPGMKGWAVRARGSQHHGGRPGQESARGTGGPAVAPAAPVAGRPPGTVLAGAATE
jgi:hypothetical protein